MKRIYTILVAVLLTASVFAQTPEKMSYQAVVRNASNNLVTNTQVGMQIGIYQGSVTGILVYEETQTPQTNANGLLTIEIGGQTGFDTISWANGPYFIETGIDPTGGTNYSTITGTSQLLTVPYALHAKTAESITGTVNYTETDPIFGASVANGITDVDIANWNNHTVDTDTHLDSTDIATLGFVAGAHTVDTDTQLDSTDIAALGFVAGAHTVDTDTQLDSTDIAALGFVAGEQNLSEVSAISNSVNTQLKDVTDPTDAQDAATKAYVDLLETKIEELRGELYGVTDYDGNFYPGVKIGTQVWMSENLNVTHYPNGDAIPLVTDNTAWGNLADDNTSDAYSYYNNNASSEADTYGALYTYAAAIGDNWARDNTANQGVCPNGWHLPTFAEWTTLTDYLGTDAGSKLAGNATLWTDGTLDQNANFGTSGFSALPSGDRNSSGGTFGGLGDGGLWWSATESGSNAGNRHLDYGSTSVDSRHYGKSNGFSVRCIRD